MFVTDSFFTPTGGGGGGGNGGYTYGGGGGGGGGFFPTFEFTPTISLGEFGVSEGEIALAGYGQQSLQGINDQRFELTLAIAQNPALAEVYAPILEELDTAEENLQPVLDYTKKRMESMQKMAGVISDAAGSASKGATDLAGKVGEMADFSSLLSGIKPRGKGGGGGGGGMPGS